MEWFHRSHILTACKLPVCLNKGNFFRCVTDSCFDHLFITAQRLRGYRKRVLGLNQVSLGDLVFSCHQKHANRVNFHHCTTYKDTALYLRWQKPENQFCYVDQ